MTEELTEQQKYDRERYRKQREKLLAQRREYYINFEKKGLKKPRQRTPRRIRDHERYMRQRDERLLRQREYYGENREKCRQSVKKCQREASLRKLRNYE